MTRIRVCAVAVLISLTASTVHASIEGVTVGSSTSSTGVGSAVLFNGQEYIEYFIPLSSSFAGVYGVTNVPGGTAGLVADSGWGYGYNDESTDALQMFLRFDLSSLLAGGITIDFEFRDLDLSPINDPIGFYEDVQFNYFDDSNVMHKLTDTILNADQAISGLPGGVAATLGHGGKNDPITISFSGEGLTSIVNSISGNEFYMRLDFSSKYDRYATNTSEFLMSGVMSQPASYNLVPAPSSAITFFGLALCVAAGGMLRRCRGS